MTHPPTHLITHLQLLVLEPLLLSQQLPCPLLFGNVRIIADNRPITKAHTAREIYNIRGKLTWGITFLIHGRYRSNYGINIIYKISYFQLPIHNAASLTRLSIIRLVSTYRRRISVSFQNMIYPPTSTEYSP